MHIHPDDFMQLAREWGRLGDGDLSAIRSLFEPRRETTCADWYFSKAANSVYCLAFFEGRVVAALEAPSVRDGCAQRVGEGLIERHRRTLERLTAARLAASSQAWEVSDAPARVQPLSRPLQEDDAAALESFMMKPQGRLHDLPALKAFFEMPRTPLWADFHWSSVTKRLYAMVGSHGWLLEMDERQEVPEQMVSSVGAEAVLGVIARAQLGPDLFGWLTRENLRWAVPEGYAADSSDKFGPARGLHKEVV